MVFPVKTQARTGSSSTSGSGSSSSLKVGWRLPRAIVDKVKDCAQAEGMSVGEAATALLAVGLRRPRTDLRGDREVPLLRESSLEYLLARRVSAADLTDAGNTIDPAIRKHLLRTYGEVAAERVELRLIRGYSYDEIGARTGKSKQAVEQHLSRLAPRLGKDKELRALLLRVAKRNTRGEVYDDDQ